MNEFKKTFQVVSDIEMDGLADKLNQLLEKYDNIKVIKTDRRQGSYESLVLCTEAIDVLDEGAKSGEKTTLRTLAKERKDLESSLSITATQSEVHKIRKEAGK